MPKAIKVKLKAAYDRDYRAANAREIKRRKAAAFRATYDPAKAKIERARRAKWHADYCRRYYANPKAKAGKVAYDALRRAREYREFGDAYLVYLELMRTIRTQVPDKYERAKARGYYDRPTAQQRRRDAQVSRW